MNTEKSELDAQGNGIIADVIKSLPSVEEINKKWFFPTDKVKDEAARVGALWMRHRILGELEH